MSGTRTSQEKLNYTLESVCKILLENNIKDWFLAYGTLLGIARENSCIKNDDDIDIIINEDYDVLKKTLIKNNFMLTYSYGINDSKRIIKTIPTQSLASIDFYMATIKDGNDFYDPWERAHWQDCYIDSNKKIFEERKWMSTTLHLPKNYESKLECRYGNWKKPSGGKRGGHSFRLLK